MLRAESNGSSRARKQWGEDVQHQLFVCMRTEKRLQGAEGGLFEESKTKVRIFVFNFRSFLFLKLHHPSVKQSPSDVSRDGGRVTQGRGERRGPRRDAPARRGRVAPRVRGVVAAVAVGSCRRRCRCGRCSSSRSRSRSSSARREGPPEHAHVVPGRLCRCRRGICNSISGVPRRRRSDRSSGSVVGGVGSEAVNDRSHVRSSSRWGRSL